jgi:hypothetical protein
MVKDPPFLPMMVIIDDGYNINLTKVGQKPKHRSGAEKRNQKEE